MGSWQREQQNVPGAGGGEAEFSRDQCQGAMGCPGTRGVLEPVSAVEAQTPVPGSFGVPSHRALTLLLQTRCPCTAADAPIGATSSHISHTSLLSSSRFCLTPTRPPWHYTYTCLCVTRALPRLKSKRTSCVCNVGVFFPFFLLINRLVNFFLSYFFSSSVLPRHSVCTICFFLCICVPVQTLPGPSLPYLHCCPVITGVTNSAYSFIPACSEDHVCWKMVQKEWNLFYEMSLSHGHFDG